MLVKMTKNKIFFLAGMILFSLVTGCKKEPGKPPTDEEILGNVVKPAIIDEYIYPVRPGMPEWALLQGHDEMEQVLTIPDTVLQKISTWGLCETCFNYPLGSDYAAYNFAELYINNLAISFNGLVELFSREDAPTVILYNYRNIDVSKFNTSLDMGFLEMVIGCDSFVSKLDKRQKQYLVLVALEKYSEQRTIFHGSLLPCSIFIMINTMINAGYKPFIDYCNAHNENSVFYMLYTSAVNISPEKIEEFATAFTCD
jgi:hypothetical protein